MSLVKIYTNDAHEIKAVGYTDNPSLKEYIIDREKVFGNASDAFIMGYTYEPTTVDGAETVIVTPYKDLDVLNMFNRSSEQAAGNDVIIVNHSTVDEVREFHKKALGRVGSALIQAGIDVNGEHFSLTAQDQSNIQQLVLQVQAGHDAVPYHPDGGDCRLFTAEEIMAIGTMATACVTYHTTRMNSLFGLLKTKTNKKDILAVQYDTMLDDERMTRFNAIMEACGVTDELRAYFDASVAAAGTTTGEIYSNIGSMISEENPDTEKLLDVVHATATITESGPVQVVIPATFVDHTKVNEDSPVYTVSGIFHVLTNVDNTVNEEYDTRYSMEYQLVNGAAQLVMTVDNGQVLSALLPMSSVENRENDTVCAEQRFFIICTGETPVVTDDYNTVLSVLNIVEPEESMDDQSVEEVSVE